MNKEITEIVTRDEESLAAYFELVQSKTAIIRKVMDCLRTDAEKIAADLQLKVGFRPDELLAKESTFWFWDDRMKASNVIDMRPNRKRQPPLKTASGQPPVPGASFLEACFACLCPEATLRRLGRYRNSSVGAPPLLPVGELMLAVVFHAVLSAGTLAEHLHLLCGRRYAESTLAERRAALPWRVWTDLLRQALRRLADRQRHPDAF